MNSIIEPFKVLFGNLCEKLRGASVNEPTAAPLLQGALYNTDVGRKNKHYTEDRDEV